MSQSLTVLTHLELQGQACRALLVISSQIVVSKIGNCEYRALYHIPFTSYRPRRSNKILMFDNIVKQHPRLHKSNLPLIIITIPFQKLTRGKFLVVHSRTIQRSNLHRTLRMASVGICHGIFLARRCNWVELSPSTEPMSINRADQHYHSNRLV